MPTPDDAGTRSRSGSRRAGPRSTDGSDEDPSVVRQYYPLFESLIALFLDTRRLLRSFRSYLKEEVGRRSRLLVRGIVFLTAALTFTAATVAFLVLTLYLLLRQAIGIQWLAALAMTFLALLAVVGLLLLMMSAFRQIALFEDRVGDGRAGPRTRRAERARAAAAQAEPQTETDEGELPGLARRRRRRRRSAVREP